MTLFVGVKQMMILLQSVRCEMLISAHQKKNSYKNSFPHIRWERLSIDNQVKTMNDNALMRTATTISMIGKFV